MILALVDKRNNETVRKWPVSNHDGRITLQAMDLIEATGILRGSFIHNLELRDTNNQPVRNQETLAKQPNDQPPVQLETTIFPS